jgi:hypothetical protein
MTFHMQCPYGHLLAAEESQAGQQCTCPVCATLFIIPAPLGTPSPPRPGFPEPEPVPEAAAAAPSPFPEIDVFTSKRSRGLPGFPPEPEEPAASEPEAEPAPPGPAVMSVTESELLHIPCPNGHVLETPAEMLDHEVLCPHCKAQFHLRRQDSEEYKRKKRDDQAREERRQGQTVMFLSAVVLVVVLLGLLYLIAHSTGD